jgi:hypothetical protein
MFQMFEPLARERPLQLVAGNGGTRLDPPNQKHPGEIVKVLSSYRSYGVEGSVLAISRYGFVTLRRTGPSWDLELHDSRGDTIAKCTIPDSRSKPAPCNKT